MTGKDQTTQNQTTDQTQTQNQPQPQPQAQPANKQQTQEPRDTPAPRYHASESLTWFQQRQQQQEKDYAKNKVDPGVPDSARPVNIADSKFVALPAGGIAALADSLYPDDKNDAEKMHQHVFDLLVANRDVLRDDTSSTVGTMVRIP